MEKRNLLHRVLGLVEKELEATLAVLILLAAVVGYTLAGTETAVQSLTIQQAANLSIGTGSYSTLTFDPAITGSGVYRVRNYAVPTGMPEDITTIKGKGMSGGSSEANYEVSVSLSAPYSGSLYVWGTGDISLNDKTITSSTIPVSISSTSKLTLKFAGTAKIQAISTGAKSSSDNVQTVASIFVLPNAAEMTVNQSRIFVALVTDQNGQAISNAPVTWSVTPKELATIDPATGEVVALKEGKLVVTAKVNGNSASATITISPKVEPKEVASTPATNTTKETTTPSTTNITKSTGNATSTTSEPIEEFGNIFYFSETVKNQIAEFVTGGPAEAATAETATSAQTATKTADALFSPTIIAERVAATGNAIPTSAEVKAATTGMTLTQKVVATVKTSLNQMSFEIKTMVKGLEVKDKTGKTILKKDSLGQRIGNLIRGITGGANAGTDKISAGSEGDEIDKMEAGGEGDID